MEVAERAEAPGSLHAMCHAGRRGPRMRARRACPTVRAVGPSPGHDRAVHGARARVNDAREAVHGAVSRRQSPS
jgi:hypothetical protein